MPLGMDSFRAVLDRTPVGYCEIDPRCLAASLPQRVALEIENDTGTPVVDADAQHPRQLVVQLVMNAADAIGGGRGTIRVELGVERLGAGDPRLRSAQGEMEPGVYLRLSLSDDGCGMDEATRKRVFDPFFTTKATKPGLGLAAVCGIVRSHRGGLRVRSRPGAGSTLDVLLPASERAAGSEAPPAAGPEQAARESCRARILLVDDESAVRDVGQRMLERLGHTVELAADGLQAIEIFRERHDELGLVILDLKMPRMGGEEALAWMRHIDPEARILLSSGFHEKDAVTMFGEDSQSRVGFLHKPYRLDALKEALSKSLG